MKKIMFVLVAMMFVAFGFSAGVYAGGMDKSIGKDASKDLSFWIGKDVKNAQGDDLGDISQFITDENGKHSLVIISHGGFMGMGDKKVAVPFSALSFNESEKHAVLDVDREQFANAPAVPEGEDLSDRTFAEQVYRYFGERPYWSDEGTTHEYYGDTPDDTREYFGADEGLDAEEDFEFDSGSDIGSDTMSDY